MAGGAEEDDAHGEAATALYTYEAVAEGQLSVAAGDALRVLNHDNSAEWWYCARVRAASRSGEEGELAAADAGPEQVGYVPRSYVQLTQPSPVAADIAGSGVSSAAGAGGTDTSSIVSASSSSTVASSPSAASSSSSSGAARSASSASGLARWVQTGPAQQKRLQVEVTRLQREREELAAQLRGEREARLAAESRAEAAEAAQREQREDGVRRAAEARAAAEASLAALRQEGERRVQEVAAQEQEAHLMAELRAEEDAAAALAACEQRWRARCEALEEPQQPATPATPAAAGG
jgi:hypothetical protein